MEQLNYNIMKILIVLTSHSQLGTTDGKTGFWIEEFAAPYYLFQEAGATITLASPNGGQPPIDPKVMHQKIKHQQQFATKQTVIY